ncbi:MAG: CPCC family cysteine-rich protein [Pseudomonadota bacterium]
MEMSGPPFTCPCCGFPSLPCWLTATCSICWWEIDSHDVPPEDAPSGVNHGYSLRRARANFHDHGDMYDAGKAGAYLSEGSPGRDRLLAYVTDVRAGRRDPDQVTLERLIAEDRACWPWRNQPYDAEAAAREEALLQTLTEPPEAGGADK